MSNSAENYFHKVVLLCNLRATWMGAAAISLNLLVVNSQVEFEIRLKEIYAKSRRL